MGEAHETAETLQKAHELLAKPGVWLKGVAARTSWGRAVGHKDKNATSFCMLAAIARFSEAGDIEFARHLLTQVVGPNPTEWQDAPVRTLDDVLGALERMIALAQADSEVRALGHRTPQPLCSA